MADGPALGTAYLRIAGDFSGLNTQAVGLFKSDKWSKLGKVAGAGLAAGVVAGGALKALYDIGEAFDDVSDKIRTQTGATGKELKKLEGNFRSVVRRVPADFDTASSAVAGLAQRLDLTGKPLVRLSRQMTELARITDTDVESNIQSVTRAFGDWEVKTKDQSEQLDRFFRASQESGAAVSDLAEQVVQFGAPLRQVGFTLDEATAMFAAFEKAGVNTQTMMPGLRMALKNFLMADIDPRKGLQQAFADIESGTMKTSDALTLFGQRAGADMVEAIQQGRFELDELTKSISTGDETIRKAGRQTMDFSEHWLKFKNNVMLGLEPVATRVFKAVGESMKDVTKIISDPKLTSAEKFDKFFALVAGAISDAIPKLVELGGKAAGAVFKGFMDAGVWGKVAVGALIFKMLGGLGAISAAMTAAGGTLATRLGGGLKAGLARLGIAGAILGGISAATQGGGIGDRMQNFLSGMTLGLIPAAKDLGEELAGQISGTFGPAFEAAIKHKSIPALRQLNEALVKAVAGFEAMGQEVPPELRAMAEKGSRSFDRLREGSAEVRREIDHLSNTWGSSLSEINRETDRNMRAIDEKMGKHSKHGRQAISDNFMAAIQAIKNSMDSGVIAAGRGAKEIHQVLVKQLRSYGIKDVEGFLNRSESVQRSGAEGKRGLRAGGLAGVVPGLGAGDSETLSINGVPIAKVEPREGIFVGNRTLMDRLQEANSLFPRMAKGGIVELLGPHNDPAGHGGSNMHLHIAMLQGIEALGRKLQKMGWLVGEHPAFGGVGGMHSPTGYHYTGDAIDVNWPDPGQEFAKIRALLPSLERLAGGKGVGGIGAADLKLPRFGGRFPLAQVVAQGLNNSAAAVEKVIGKRLGAREGAEPGAAMTGSGNVEGTFAKVAKRLSKSKVATLALGMAGYAESGMTDVAGGHSTSEGALQLLASTAAGFGLDPHDEAAVASHFLLRGYYGRGGANALAASGLPAHLVAQGVQGSAFSSGSNYLAQKGPAQAWMRRFGLRLGGLVGMKKGGKAKGYSGPWANVVGAAGAAAGPIAAKIKDALPPKLAETIRRLRKQTPTLDEQIATASTLAAFATSPAGTDLSAEERAQIVALNQGLLGNLTGRAGALTKGIGLLPAGGKLRGRLVTELGELQGITGAGGRILDVKQVLDDLGASSSVTDSQLDSLKGQLLTQQIEDLRRELALSRAQMPVFGGIFHGGGVVPGPLGAERTIIAQGGEQVGGGPMEVRVIVEDGAVDPSKIRVEVVDTLNEIARKHPRGAVVGHRSVLSR